MRRFVSSHYWFLVIFGLCVWSNNAFCLESDAFNIQVQISQLAPVLSFIPDIETNEDVATNPIPITITDSDTPLNQLSIITQSSNQTIVPNENIQISGDGTNRTIIITPSADEFGELSITVAVNDMQHMTIQTFSLVVHKINDPPLISHISDQSVKEDYATNPIAFTLTDVDSDLNSLLLSSWASDTTLVDHNQISIMGDSANRWLTIRPRKNAFGQTTIFVTASDGESTYTSWFHLSIIPQNDPPTISSLIDQVIEQDTAIHGIPFTISDADGDQLTIWTYSSNTSLIPPIPPHMIITPSQSVQTVPSTPCVLSLSAKPTQNQYGQAKLTLVVSDPYQLTASAAFAFTVFQSKYLITTIANGSGSITPVNPVIAKNAQVTLRFKPDTGNVIKNIWIDNEPKGPMPRFIFYSVKQPHAITALFGPPDVYTVTSIAETGGSINPSGNIVVNAGADKLFVISSRIGYELIDVKVNNNSLGPVVIYQMQNILQNQTIHAYYRQTSPPVSDFQMDKIVGTIPLTVQFQDTSYIPNAVENDTITEWLWDFGDGSPKSSRQHPKHQFADIGSYTISLTTTGPGGLTHTHVVSQAITVQPSTIDVQFSANHTSIKKGESVVFTSQTNITSNVTYQWDFGDNQFSFDANPTHVYQSAGNYSVSLTISTLDNQNTKVKSNFIRVSGRTIQGFVYAGDRDAQNTGVPIASAWVELWLYGKEPIAYTFSDQAGSYTFTDLPAASGFVLQVFPPIGNTDYFEQFYNGKQTFDTATKLSTLKHDVSNLEVVLRQTPRLGITGRIHNGSSGIATLEVAVFSESANNFSTYTLTDENGYYTLTGLKEASDYVVIVYNDQSEYFYAIPSGQTPGSYAPVCGDSTFRFELATGVTPTEDPITQHIDIVLCHTGMITGQVWNSNNQLLSNVWVNARSENLQIENGSLTDQNGVYTITGLTIVSEGEILTKGYVVEVPSVTYPYQAYALSDTLQNAQRISADNNTAIDFFLKTSCALSGRVMDKYAIPVPDVQVSAYSYSDPGNKQGVATSDDAGYYTIVNLPFAQDYIVGAFSSYYPIQYFDLKTKEEKNQATQVSLANGDVTDINFMLDEGAIIKGYVYIDQDGARIPANNIWVNIHSETNTQSGGTVQTDQDGYYEMTGLDDAITDYIIRVTLSGYQPAYYNSTKPNTTVYTYDEAMGVEPSTDIERNMLVVQGFKIKGRVTYNGSPISGLTVIAYSEEGASGSAVTTKNNQANYEISGLSNGTYTVFVSTNKYAEAIKSKVLLYAANISDVNFALQLPERFICGMIYGLENNKSVNILTFSTSGQSSKMINIVGDGAAKPYTINGLGAFSDYQLQLYSTDYPDQVYNNKTKITEADLVNLSSSSATGIDFTVVVDVSTISGEVVFPGTANFGDKAWVDVISDSTGSQGGAEVKKRTTTTSPYPDDYTISGLKRAPDYIIHVWSDKYLTQYYENEDAAENASMIDTTTQANRSNVNFTLDPGAIIYGKITDEYLQAVSGIYVEASSDNANSVRGTMSISDGTYTIKGLKAASDFKIKAVKPGVDVPFFYSLSGTVRDRAKASSISTLADNPTDINIALSDGLSIAGTIRDSESTPILNADIWVQISSKTKQIKVGDYAKDDGSYMISGLPSGNDYEVSVQPTAGSSYIAAIKTNIESGNNKVDFYLTNGYLISGIVKDTSNQPIRNVKIEINSTTASLGKWVLSNTSGEYTIQGLPASDDYILTAIPPNDSDLVEFVVLDMIINTNTTKNITLEPALKFSGTIYQQDGVTPISNAWVTVFSDSLDQFLKGTRTDSNGVFSITNIPDATDYVIKASATGYIGQEITNQSPGGSAIQISLESGGSISGTVKDVNGNPIQGARVKAESSSLNTVVICETSANGKFELKQLKSIDRLGNEINDYVVKAEATGYQGQSRVQRQVGDLIQFVLTKGGQISGTVTDEANQIPPALFSINVFAFERLSDTELKTPAIKVSINEDGTFLFTGLKAATPYVLQFKSNKKGSLINKSQWAGSGQLGVTRFNGSGQDEDGPAIDFTPDAIVNFKFRGSWE